ncbi:MAG: general secretion pathway protein GspJ [Comamonas sp. SCN 65-56]|uniref:prepilin-type N-terminal cleavage/methylation domain-containing protein n=1 Tax=Comamonas sp. SCN 65-56 TaxID=1660095 RepID=UPI000868492C|nr:prepilin-type N-terminal cleavage/methylation domain-containing protein [Comamonas sp. SCN 65-56]ODS90850.1 MAG: general secretion pathway protein GspJ [Comamonas sp. SCN 65-56]
MKPRSSSRQRGFTLIELLIALAVTVAVIALLFSGYALIGRTQERGQQTMDRAARMLQASDWLSGKFDTLRMLAQQDGGRFVLFFSGNAAGAMWVAPLPERGEAGGLHVLRATPLRHDDGRVDLAIEALPYDGAGMALDWSHALREVLVPDLRTLQWYYQDGATGEWSQQWDATRASYPARVRLQLADAQGAWPELVFALPRAR